jgi:dTDP-4-dehydrorhamnose reductase
VKVLVLGAQGQVGQALMRAQWPEPFRVVGMTRETVDVTDSGSIAAGIKSTAPDLVINATAYTAVDKAENDCDAAFAVNAEGVEKLGIACAVQAIPLIHISTDYVFDGEGTRAYVETDAVQPLGVYGASKAAGETALRMSADKHIIVRTSWVYSDHGQNFAKTMLRLGREREQLNVVADQYGAPTAAFAIADALITIAGRIASSEAGGVGVPWGTYHFCARGETTWHGFAEHIFGDMHTRTGRRPFCHAIATADYPTPAQRPTNSRLDCSLIETTFGIVRAPWQQNLDQVLSKLYAL